MTNIAPLVESLLEPYLTENCVTISRGGDATKVQIFKTDRILIDLTIPDEVLEWFVSVIDQSSGDELIYDWLEYYQTEGETDEQLEAMMLKDISSLLEDIVNVPVRIQETTRPRFLGFLPRKSIYVLQHRPGAEWIQIFPV